MEKDLKKGRLQAQQPWLDKNGRTLSKTMLRRIGRKWDAKTWEEYLKSIEYSQREQITGDFEAILHKRSEKESLENYLSDPEHEKELKSISLEKKVKELIWDLPFEEMAVIKALFYDGLSTRKTATKMGISEKHVRDIRDSAIKRLLVNLKDEKLENQ